jgi:hypothetical protein
LLHEYGSIDPLEIDLRFEQPTKQWADARLQPTVNFFLFDIEEFHELRNNVPQTSRENGRALQRRLPRRFNLRYMVTAWSSVAADEQTLLWRILALLLQYNPLPSEMLPAELQAIGLPFYARAGKYDGAPTPFDFWSALQLPPRPVLFYTVTAPLDIERVLEAPLVLSRTLRSTRPDPAAERQGLGMAAGSAVLDLSATSIAGVVRDQQGQPIAGVRVALADGAQEVLTGAEGLYHLRVRGEGPVQLRCVTPDEKTHLVEYDLSAISFDITL